MIKFTERPKTLTGVKSESIRTKTPLINKCYVNQCMLHAKA